MKENLLVTFEECVELGKSLRREGKNVLAIKAFKKAKKMFPVRDDVFLKNKILNEIEVTKRKKILKSKPLSLTVVLTNKCTLKCKMCGFWDKSWCDGKDFDITESRVIEIEKLLPYLDQITWTGGEIFLSKYFERLFNKASTYPHLKQMILTNGSLINEKWARKLTSTDITICYSIDGATKKTYENIRIGGKFEDLLRNIELINKYKEKCSHKIVTGIQFTVMKTNYHEMKKMLDFAKEHGFSFIRFYPILLLEDTENIFYQNDLEAANYLENIHPQLIKKALQYKIELIYQLPEIEYFGCYKDQLSEPRRTEMIKRFIKNSDKDLLCYSPWRNMHIDNDRVRSECYCLQDIGDLKKNSIEEIWNGKNMQKYRKKIIKKCFDLCDYKCIMGLISWISDH